MFANKAMAVSFKSLLIFGSLNVEGFKGFKKRFIEFMEFIKFMAYPPVPLMREVRAALLLKSPLGDLGVKMLILNVFKLKGLKRGL